MPLPTEYSEKGYRGVEISTTKVYGFFVVQMSHNKHRFASIDEAHRFIDDAIAKAKGK